jgi:hypothetical protein
MNTGPNRAARLMLPGSRLKSLLVKVEGIGHPMSLHTDIL